MVSQEPKNIYLVSSSVSMHLVVHEDSEYYYVLPPGIKPHRVKKTSAYLDKLDAMYANFVRRDKPISNYKSSKYKDYYYKRARKENPDLLI